MTIESEQRSAARVAGLFYLLMMFTGLFRRLYLRSPRIVPDDAVQTAKNIAGSEHLFRLGIVAGLVTAVRNAHDRGEEVQVIVGADKNATHGTVTHLLDVLKGAGVTRFAIQIEAEQPAAR